MNSLKSFTIPTVGAVAPADAERAVAVLTLAFSADPVTRWTYPEPAQYLALFPVLVRAFGGALSQKGPRVTSRTMQGQRSGFRPVKSSTKLRWRQACHRDGRASLRLSSKRWLPIIRRSRTGICR